MKTNEKVNAIVIDPETKTIYPVTLTKGDKGWDEIKKVIDCDMVELAVNFNEDALMYCDEEGWCKNDKNYCFEFDGVIVPGKAVVIHDDGEIGYPEEWETEKMFKYIGLLNQEVKWLGEKTYEQAYPHHEAKEYTVEESIQHFMQRGASREQAEQMVKLFGTIQTF